MHTYGSILNFWAPMSLKFEVAAVLRALRHLQGGGYARLSDTTARRTIGELERAQTGVTLDKLAELAKALEFELPALVILCVSLQENASIKSVIESTTACLDRFASSGGLGLMRGEITEGVLLKRSRGKPRNNKVITEIHRLRAEGKNQSEAARELGIPRTTVRRHWSL
jgi:transcriptional regulator of acetoin/glycerol metabolism